jgi:hypothetical protein
MADHAETGGTSIRESVRALRGDLSREHAEEKLGDWVSDRPLVQHLLRWGVLGRALAVAAVLTAIFLLLTSPPFAAVVLILSFFGSWVFMAARQYDRRRPTKPIDEDDEE